MTTTILKSIGNGGSANGYDYGDFNAFAAAMPSNLVTADEQWIAEVYATHGELVFTTSQVITGKTTDATRNIIVRAASGQGFADNSNKLTNALRYNASNGAALKMNTHAWGTAFDFQSVSRTEGLQFSYTGSGPEDVLDAGSNTVYGCIIDSVESGYQWGIVRARKFINSIAIARNRSGYSEYILRHYYGGSDARISGSVLIALGGTYTGIGQENGDGLGYSSAIFGCSTAFSNDGTAGSYTFTNCATNLSSLSGTGNLTSLTASNQFENTTSGALDLRAKSSGSLVAAGVRDQTYTNDLDILKQTRSTTAPTIGAFEYVGGGGDTTAPTLTSASVTSVGTTTATGNVTTDEGNGTLYSVVSTSATAPSVAQIQAGQNASGAAAVWSGNQPVSSTGAKNFSITGLANSTSYYAFFQHKDVANNNSSVVSSAQFTTASPPTITITDLKDLTTGTLRANETGITAIINNVTTGALVVKLTGLTSTAGGDMSISDAALVASTQYRVTIILSDGSEGTWKYTAA